MSKSPVRHKAATLTYQISLMWLAIIACVLNNHISNEPDVLPFARQFVDHDWLPTDWYLNLNIDYRQPFDAIFGFIVSMVGFQYGAALGRLLVYFILAIAMYTFCRTLRLRFWIGLGILIFFLNHQSLIAGEWIAGGVDTKTIAYALVLLSVSTFIRKQYLAGFAFAGAAMSFHALVGGYAMFCTFFALLLIRTKRSEWRQIVESSWPFLVTGFWGLFVTIKQLLPQSNIDTTTAWEIYVQYRVPHHVLPSAWTGHYWIIEFALAICLFLTIYFIQRSSAARFLAAYALGSTVLFGIGLLIYISGNIDLLRYYWFRFPDVMIPFLSVTLLAMVLNTIANKRLAERLFSGPGWHRAKAMWPQAAPVILILVIVMLLFHSMHQPEGGAAESLTSEEAEADTMFEWIKYNTPEESIFLIDPTMEDFYLDAQRAMFVSFKHSPQSPDDILEWYKRIELCNGNRPPLSAGYAAETELQTNFYSLDETAIRGIADEYGIEYYLGQPEHMLTFEPVHSTPEFTLYKIR